MKLASILLSRVKNQLLLIIGRKVTKYSPFFRTFTPSFNMFCEIMMKKIINPWRNHEGYNCFGCSPDNPIGLHMEFYEDGDYIVSTWHPEHNYQGWVDTMHGGILSTLIDEVCGWVVTRKLQTSGYTVQLNVKFRKAVPTTEPELTIRAKVSKQVRNLAYISAEITNSKGELCNEGEAIYFLRFEKNSSPNVLKPTAGSSTRICRKLRQKPFLALSRP